MYLNRKEVTYILYHITAIYHLTCVQVFPVCVVHKGATNLHSLFSLKRKTVNILLFKHNLILLYMLIFLISLKNSHYNVNFECLYYCYICLNDKNQLKLKFFVFAGVGAQNWSKM